MSKLKTNKERQGINMEDIRRREVGAKVWEEVTG